MSFSWLHVECTSSLAKVGNPDDGMIGSTSVREGMTSSSWLHVRTLFGIRMDKFVEAEQDFHFKAARAAAA